MFSVRVAKKIEEVKKIKKNRTASNQKVEEVSSVEEV